MWKKILTISLWSLLAVATCTLLIAAMQKKDEKKCSGINIEINGAHDLIFVDKKDVMKVLQNNGAEKGKEVEAFDLQKIENMLSKNAWVKKAELFFDNKQVLHVTVEEREPIARIFTLQGSSYYIDSSCKRLPLSDELSARVPMFSSFPSDKKVLSKPDSTVLQDVKKIAQYISKDSFWLAQIAQVDITAQGTYEITPVLGNQVIKIGDAENLDTKFAKLMGFYKQVWSKTGFEKYETIDVQYQGQIVAAKRGEKNTTIDTSKAMMQMGNAMQQMKLAMNDTSFSAPIAKPETITKQDSAKQIVSKKDDVKNKTEKKKEPVIIKKKDTPAANKKQPKAVLKKKANN